MASNIETKTHSFGCFGDFEIILEETLCRKGKLSFKIYVYRYFTGSHELVVQIRKCIGSVMTPFGMCFHEEEISFFQKYLKKGYPTQSDSLNIERSKTSLQIVKTMDKGQRTFFLPVEAIPRLSVFLHSVAHIYKLGSLKNGGLENAVYKPLTIGYLYHILKPYLYLTLANRDLDEYRILNIEGDAAENLVNYICQSPKFFCNLLKLYSLFNVADSFKEKMIRKDEMRAFIRNVVLNQEFKKESKERILIKWVGDLLSVLRQ